MKKHLVLILALLTLLCVCAIVVSAHSGGTDENGGHYDASTGEYHYHHGYSAHEHIDGECVFDFENNVDHDRDDSSSYFEDNVDHDRDSSSKSNSKKNNTPKAPLWLQYVVGICFLLPMPMGGLFVFRESFREYKKNPTRKNRIDLYFFSFLCSCCIVGFVITLIAIFA